MISYSFHLSTGKHSLTTCRKVSGASKHNLRKYESEDYDRAQIAILRGGDTNILDDVKAIYHQEFDEAVAVHNAGKRKDRQIKDYLQYVSDNAKNEPDESPAQSFISSGKASRRIMPHILSM